MLINVGFNMDLYNEILEKNKVLVDDIKECVFDFFKNNQIIFTNDRDDTTVPYPEDYGRLIIVKNKNAEKLKQLLLNKYKVNNVTISHCVSDIPKYKAFLSVEFLKNNSLTTIYFYFENAPERNEILNKEYFEPSFRFTDINNGVTLFISKNYTLYEIIENLKLFRVFRFINKKNNYLDKIDFHLINHFNLSKTRIDINFNSNIYLLNTVNLFLKIEDIKTLNNLSHNNLSDSFIINDCQEKFIYNILIKKEDVLNQLTTEMMDLYHLENDYKFNIEDYNFKINFNVFEKIIG